MPNWCDNTLELSIAERPLWLDAPREWDDAMPLPNDDRYMFSPSISCVPTIGWVSIKICFLTKWAPPIDFYQWLVEQPWVLFFYANYFEPGCQVLGEFRYEEGTFIDNFVWVPDSFYSDVLDVEVFKDEPHDLYFEYQDKDTRMKFEDYMKCMYDELSDFNGKIIEDEVQQCAKRFDINLEDQYWVEFIEARIT